VIHLFWLTIESGFYGLDSTGHSGENGLDSTGFAS